jgi:hypothetical protein
MMASSMSEPIVTEAQNQKLYYCSMVDRSKVNRKYAAMIMAKMKL